MPPEVGEGIARYPSAPFIWAVDPPGTRQHCFASEEAEASKVGVVGHRVRRMLAMGRRLSLHIFI